jgi:3-oxoacyl-[acyl-carrier protein] reductase
MDLGLKGKKALVTGGTRGIGRAIAEEFANEGCHVGICARNAATVGATVTSLQRHGLMVMGQAVDVSDGMALKAWVEAAGAAFGGLDIVVSNVSGFGMSPDDVGWRQSFEVDVMGAVHLVEAAMPYLERSDAAAIVVISSGAAFENFYDVFPNGIMQPYAAMKAALTNYVSSLSRTLAPKGIRANTVASGAVSFPGGRWHQREQEGAEVVQKMLARSPMGRFGRPAEIAKAVVFLASPAASFITGTNLLVDGGTTYSVQF